MDVRERWMDFPSQLFTLDELNVSNSRSDGKFWDLLPAPFTALNSKSFCNEVSRTASPGSDLSYDDEMDVVTESFSLYPNLISTTMEGLGPCDNPYFNAISSEFGDGRELMDFTRALCSGQVEPTISDVEQNPNWGFVAPNEAEKSSLRGERQGTNKWGKSEDSVFSTICSSPSGDGNAPPSWVTRGVFSVAVEGFLGVESMPQLPDTPSMLDSSVVIPDENSKGEEAADYRGMRLVHLLMAAAEAVEARNRDLASVILVRLKALASPMGNTMERLAAYLSQGLHTRLEGGRGPGLFPSASPDSMPGDVLASFQVLQEICPYIKFGHLSANQAILEAVQRERRVHIIDFDIMEGIQWPSLMQALVTRKEGPPHLRITALTRASTGSPANRRGLSTVQETGKRLAAFAASIGLPFTFHQTRLDSEEMFRPSGARTVKGEALVVNCMLHLPHMTHRNPNSISSFLAGVREINPCIVTLVEEQLPPMDADQSYTAHFMETFHHYSAIFDSVEASFPPQSVARSLVERIFFGPRITRTLASKHTQLNSNNTAIFNEKRNWSSFIGSQLGFNSCPLSMFNQCQAKLLLGLFNDGYRIEEDQGKLILGWKSRAVISVSSWVPIQS